MAAPLQRTYMGQLHTGLCKAHLKNLKGKPHLDNEGNPVLDASGKVIMDPPSAAVLKEIREFLKDNGIDREPTDVIPLQIAEEARKFDEYEDPILLEGAP